MASQWQTPETLIGKDLMSSLPDWLQKALADLDAKAILLTEGLSNANYRLWCPQGDWVLRVNRPQSLWCNREQELANWRLAEAAGLAPALIWHSGDKLVYLSHFVAQTRPWSSVMSHGNNSLSQAVENSVNPNFGPSLYKRVPADNSAALNTALDSVFDEAKPVSLLLNLLRPLSELPVPDVALTPRVQWQEYLARLTELASTMGRAHSRVNRQSNLTPPKKTHLSSQWHRAFTQLSSLVTDIERWLVQLETCLVANQYCHRDLNPTNLLLVGDKLQCIDFEYATASHPLFELASVITSHKLTLRQRDSLIEQYLAFNPNVKASGFEAMPAAINCYWLCCAAWALLMAAEQEEESQTRYLAYFNQYQQLITI
jgi:aminoglycoside phosphotransferase (APT) family kinase protein